MPKHNATEQTDGPKYRQRPAAQNKKRSLSNNNNTKDT